MRFRFAALILSGALLGSCAYQGVVVDKSARELPFSETVGSPGSFAFMLKDSSGVVHRQLVTPEVFASYNVGDYFNDLQPAPTQHGKAAEDKVVLTAARTMPQQQSSVAATRMASAPSKIASAAPAQKHSATARKLATKSTAKSRKSHHAVASHHRAKHHKATVATAKKAKRTTPAFSTKPTDVDIVDVNGGAPRVH